MVGERGFEPPTPWSRKRQLVYKQPLNILRSGASTSTDPLILAQTCHSHPYGCPFLGAPSISDHFCFPVKSSLRPTRFSHSLHPETANAKSPLKFSGFSPAIGPLDGTLELAAGTEAKFPNAPATEGSAALDLSRRPCPPSRRANRPF